MFFTVLRTQFYKFARSRDNTLSLILKLFLAFIILISSFLKRLSYPFILLHKQPNTVYHLIRKLINLLMILGLSHLRPCHAHYLKSTIQTLFISYIDILICSPPP